MVSRLVIVMGSSYAKLDVSCGTWGSRLSARRIASETLRRASGPVYAGSWSTAAPGWIPAVVMWNPAIGFFSRVERPNAFTTWREADEASRFLRADG